LPGNGNDRTAATTPTGQPPEEFSELLGRLPYEQSGRLLSGLLSERFAGQSAEQPGELLHPQFAGQLAEEFSEQPAEQLAEFRGG
jgi:hypothetical protein